MGLRSGAWVGLCAMLAGACYGAHEAPEAWDEVSPGPVGGPSEPPAAAGGVAPPPAGPAAPPEPPSADNPRSDPPPDFDELRVSGSYYAHVCVLQRGEVRCAGDNVFGQLGRGFASAWAEPEDIDDELRRLEPVIDLPPAAQVSAGGRHSCAVTLDGEVFCWGTNERGVLGVGFGAAPERCPNGVRGELEPLDCATAPLRVDIPARIAQVEAGSTHTCARDVDGAVWCWGWLSIVGSRHYELEGLQGTPLRLPGIGPAASIGVGWGGSGPAHNCAVLRDGRLQCWGISTPVITEPAGRTGPIAVDPFDAEESASRAFALPAEQGALQVAAGNDHSCALADGGAVYCWGRNDYRQLGNDTGFVCPVGARFESTCTVGEDVVQRDPLRVAGLDAAVAISALCALREDGSVWCWRERERFETRRGLLRVDGLDEVQSIGGQCAVQRGDRVACWTATDEGFEVRDIL